MRQKSWLDLRGLDDADSDDVSRLFDTGIVSVVTTLPITLLKPALDCAARADDTTRAQEQALRDQLAAI